MTSVADTRLLITLEFPPNPEAKKTISDFIEKELREGILLPSIAITEFIETAGARIGEKAAKNRLRLLKERGIKIGVIDEQRAIAAGDLLLAHRNIPIADALIATFVTMGIADYVLTDDPHYKTLNAKTKWPQL